MDVHLNEDVVVAGRAGGATEGMPGRVMRSLAGSEGVCMGLQTNLTPITTSVGRAGADDSGAVRAQRRRQRTLRHDVFRDGAKGEGLAGYFPGRVCLQIIC